jgi:calcineurin-like phosphoesterase family protein
MAHLFTADPHFGHSRIIEFCKRPFASVGEMDSHILTRMQAAMTPEDDLWIVGDFAFGGSDQASRLDGYLASIPGRKHLVIGNHDKTWMMRLSGWTSIHDLIEVREDGTRMTLCHYPMVTFPGARHGALQLFGHVHDNWPGSRNSVNVGVDVWDFRPVGLAEIKRRAATLPVNPLWGAVEPRSNLE